VTCLLLHHAACSLLRVPNLGRHFVTRSFGPEKLEQKGKGNNSEDTLNTMLASLPAEGKREVFSQKPMLKLVEGGRNRVGLFVSLEKLTGILRKFLVTIQIPVERASIYRHSRNRNSHCFAKRFSGKAPSALTYR
jgi:hypothetical protein